MQIAIVDDRAEDRAELSACLENYMKKHQLDYTLTEFEDGENFLKAAAQVNFQLVFMDIYMENMDGIEAARRLRQKNRLCKIVFLTITEDYARMGYSLSASYYLLKPLSLHQADFEEAMELCQLKPPYEVMTLSVMADRQKLELPTEKILYIDYQNRMTRIHTAERVIPVSGGFQEVTAALQKDKRFLPCYRGVLINMDYISQVGPFRIDHNSPFCLSCTYQFQFYLSLKPCQIKLYFHRFIFLLPRLDHSCRPAVCPIRDDDLHFKWLLESLLSINGGCFFVITSRITPLIHSRNEIT